MGKNKEYYSRVWKYIRDNFGWSKKKMFATIFSLLFGAGLYCLLRGLDAMVGELITFFAFTFAPFGVLSLGYLFFQLFTAPPKLHYEMQAKAERYTPTGVTLREVNPDEFGIVPTGILLKNNKPVSIVAEANIVMAWESGKEMPEGHRSGNLGWAKDNKAVYGSIEIPVGGEMQLILEMKRQAHKPGTSLLTALPRDGKGKRLFVQQEGGGTLPVYEGSETVIRVAIVLGVEGLTLRLPQRDVYLEYKNERLHITKLVEAKNT